MVAGAALTPESLTEDIAGFRDDPLGFLWYAFPWGEKGTELEGYPDGPDEWHLKLFADMKEGIDANDRRLAAEQELDPIQMATASGHGIGKSACLAWLVIFLMSTRSVRGVVTANTSMQLEGKTWKELAKWHRLAINKDWFRWTATKFSSVFDPSSFVEAVPWSIERTEAFAGLHNEGKCVLLIMDEGSAIDDKIYEVSEGALTDARAEIFWFVFGNPTRNTGRFRECFPGGRFANRWITQTVDSRTVRITNKRQIQKWVDDYGEDSDFVRVRVRGVFPRAGSSQFIPGDIVQDARDRLVEALASDEVVVGCDVARSGENESVILVRRGRRVEEREIYRYHGIDTMQLANELASVIERTRPIPDACIVDGAGVGGGVVDRMRQMNYRVIDMNGGLKADDENQFANKRAEMWSKMRDWLRVGSIPSTDQDLFKQLISLDYGFDAKNRLMLEKKEDLVARGQVSPDIADALALTFSVRVFPRNMENDAHSNMEAISDYDEFGEKW